jgi:4-diphosphocytidyl-2-C-methyl-D-erythritol kinase
MSGSSESLPLCNDLESFVLARHPSLAEIKRRLQQAGARGVLMSGSGSTIFAIFDSAEARDGANRDLSQAGWRCYPARTLSRVEYRHSLGL